MDSAMLVLQKNQARRYSSLMNKYTFNNTLEITSHDFLLVAVDNERGIDYFTPNDEEFSSIVAMDRKHKLAIFTGFYDMDDMYYDEECWGISGFNTDYSQVCHNGVLMCNFESE